jgi:2'-5' RNA ligase superfamily protein
MTSVMPADLETALLTTVPDMPKVIRDTRLRLDPGAALGVPEHVTVTYPFLHPDDVGEATIDRLEKICSETAGFEFSLTEVRWFGEAVVWLAPRPEDPFRRLSMLIEREFGTRPYGGAYDEITPHLTIGDHGPVDQMRAAQDVVVPFLPIHARAAELALLQGGPAGWAEVRRFLFR